MNQYFIKLISFKLVYLSPVSTTALLLLYPVSYTTPLHHRATTAPPPLLRLQLPFTSIPSVSPQQSTFSYLALQPRPTNTPQTRHPPSSFIPSPNPPTATVASPLFNSLVSPSPVLISLPPPTSLNRPLNLRCRVMI